jgi:hypothetical protein
MTNMGSSWQDLLDELVAARSGDYQTEPERIEHIADTIEWILQAILEKLRDAKVGDHQ